MSAAPPAVEFRDVHKHFTRAATFSGLFGRAQPPVRAVDGISFTLMPGSVLGIAGESGSGKSTLANLLVGLEQPTSGEIYLRGELASGMSNAARRIFRRHVQMVFQDPFSSLNPRFTIGRTVEEPLVIHGEGDAASRRARAIEALEAAELRPGSAFIDRLPHELSGGQRQRVAIARAIILNPAVLVADEPVSMLDVSVRAGILRLMRRLVDQLGMSMIFITHDLSIVTHICDELAIMYRGRLVEQARATEVLRNPLHPYTKQLLAAVPVPDPHTEPVQLSQKLLAGAGTVYRGNGCRFSPRCDFALEACDRIDPSLDEVWPQHRAACIRAREINMRPEEAALRKQDLAG
ncbi:oligopeptide/dipeptide ABC transporter ATP-binding protein [Rhodoligotrophos ferricapiens]|uniref:oligopeptide/dipeptide ABC transporter ATP-binding protein n=1 Tax=Rhodoligotrophos ferricapiens TaxID=3069264 RepID=UPI00315CF650